MTHRNHSLSSTWPVLWKGASLAWSSASSILVYALLFSLLAGGVVLPPLLHLLQMLGQHDGQDIVGNYSILPWILSGRGMAWAFLLLTSSIFLLVLFLGGLFLLFALRDDSGVPRRLWLRELGSRLPEGLWIGVRWSLIVIAAILLLGLVPGLGFLIFLREHDINYYLKSQPPEWWGVIGCSAVWIVAMGFLLVRGLLRISLAFPLWVRGHGSLRRSARESWRLTRGHERRLALLLALPVALTIPAHLLLQLAIFQVMNSLLPLGSTSMRGSLAVIAGGILVFVLENVIMLSALISWLSATWTLIGAALCPTNGEDTPRPPGGSGSRAFRALVLAAGCAVLVIVVFRAVLKPPSLPPASRPRVIAHRGGAAEAPENSVEAFQLALARRSADLVEMDVAMTSDGVLILAHDSDLMRQAGEPRKLAEIGWAEMRRLTLRTPQSRGNQLAPVARLDDVLDAVSTNCAMIIEFKHSPRTPDLVPLTVDRVRARGLLDRVIFMSLDLSDITRVQALEPAARVGYFVSVEMGDFLSLKLDCLAPRHTLVNRRIVTDARSRGIPLFAWTVDDPVRVVELLELGVDGLITNEPTRVRKLVEAYFSIPAEFRALLRFRRLWSYLIQRQEFKGLVDLAGEDFQP